MHTFEIISGSFGPGTVGSGRNAQNPFKIVGAQLVQNALYFDFERQQNYKLSIRVTDSGNLQYIGTVDIFIDDVNEAPTAILTSGKIKVLWAQYGSNCNGGTLCNESSSGCLCSGSVCQDIQSVCDAKLQCNYVIDPSKYSLSWSAFRVL